MKKERYELKYDEKIMKHYAFDNENKEKLGYRDIVRVLNQQAERIKELEIALKLACKNSPIKCPSPPPRRFNLQNEYGSDESYYVEEDGGCEFGSSENCLECTINFYWQKAKEMLEKD